MTGDLLKNFNIIAKLDNVTKAYGEVVAVSDASFSVEKGRITGFIGPNGAGKTTAIKMILGLIKPQKGRVELFGKNPYYNSKVKELIGYVPEKDIFPKWIKAREYLSLMGQFHLSKIEALDRAEAVLEEIGLSEVANKRIVQFSKGMKQRIKIGQALIHKPALVIADEPFNGLDPVVRRTMFELFQKYAENFNTTFFISSHILFEMDKIAEKFILLYKGRTIAQGSPIRIREMIEDQPHSIQITTKNTKKLSSLLIENANENVVSQIKFQKDVRSNENQLIILTNNPREFYDLMTKLVVENELFIKEIKATDEGLQSLYKSLTIG
ncbi:MAG: ATP-binding cassette domain-containing protein [Candidatus Lokiarchaeota archaeon]|nr:ATP-binding cassette domain-containing protein [Candidatus Lokiarchaeota archaeon]MBD3338297.1 ATP-binding cassette domain-containing protein [Candidatus Lokiarchaeota archaeon]